MISATIRSAILIATLLVCACQPVPVRENTSTAPAPPPPSCDCPVVALPVEACPPVPESIPPAPAPAPAPAVTRPCPAPASFSRSAGSTERDRLVVGRVENVFLRPKGAASKSLKLKARIDTGAGLCSMHAHDLVNFERDGKPWVRFAVLEPKTDQPIYFEQPLVRHVFIKQLNGEDQRRSIVNMSIALGDVVERVDVTLTDRSDYVYQVLIGRNFLRDHIVVDVSRKFVASEGLHLK